MISWWWVPSFSRHSSSFLRTERIPPLTSVRQARKHLNARSRGGWAWGPTPSHRRNAASAWCGCSSPARQGHRRSSRRARTLVICHRKTARNADRCIGRSPASPIGLPIVVGYLRGSWKRTLIVDLNFTILAIASTKNLHRSSGFSQRPPCHAAERVHDQPLHRVHQRGWW